jgi:hypothetical protein
MGWEGDNWGVSVTLDAHAGEKEKEHEALWRELQIRLGELVRDARYSEIVLNPPDPIEYEECDEEETDSGYDHPCRLPRGHEGVHEALLWWGE